MHNKDSYVKALKSALYAYNHLMKTPVKVIDGVNMIEAPPDEFLSGYYDVRGILADLPEVAKQIEIMALEYRINELRKK